MLVLRLLRVLLSGRRRERRGDGDEGGRWLTGVRFPVVVIYDGASVSVCEGVEGLARMHVNRVVLAREAPIVIDADLNLYRLERLRSTRSGLWLLTHPSGVTPVAFEPVRLEARGPEAAREALLRCASLAGGDAELDARRRRGLAEASALGGFIAVLRSGEDA